MKQLLFIPDRISTNERRSIGGLQKIKRVMKNFIYASIAAVLLLIVSCNGNKSSDPAPAANNTGSTGSTGSTGGGGNTPTIDASNKYVYEVVTGHVTATDASHKFINAAYTLSPNGSVKLQIGGSVSMKVVNLNKGTLTETFYNSNTSVSVKPSNISYGVSATPNIADTAAMVYIEVTNPAEREISSTANRQIIHRYFMRDDGSSASGSFGFTTNTISAPYVKGEANQTYILNTLNRADCKIL